MGEEARIIKYQKLRLFSFIVQLSCWWNYFILFNSENLYRLCFVYITKIANSLNSTGFCHFCYCSFVILSFWSHSPFFSIPWSISLHPILPWSCYYCKYVERERKRSIKIMQKNRELHELLNTEIVKNGTTIGSPLEQPYLLVYTIQYVSDTKKGTFV